MKCRVAKPRTVREAGGMAALSLEGPADNSLPPLLLFRQLGGVVVMRCVLVICIITASVQHAMCKSSTLVIIRLSPLMLTTKL